MVMSTVALGIGLVVGNLVQPGSGLNLTDKLRESGQSQAAGAHESTTDFLLLIIPKTILSALTEGEVLQTVFVALLVGFALQSMGTKGQPILTAIGHIQRLVFKILSMIMWAAPIGAFGAIAAVVGATGMDALVSLGKIMLAFYLTCLLFVVVILGTILKAVTGISIFQLLRYLGREFLLIVSTSS